ncbi:MAG TPA: FAD:protein FMN transferase [Pirellulales bacterium]|nr:FAD:protein FMN transferase [Pirellulales bacterium]
MLRLLALPLVSLCTVAGRPGIAPLRAADTSPLGRYEFAQVEMGMQFKLLLYAADQTAANRAAAAAFDRIHQLNGVMSDYDPASELSRLSDTAGQGRAVKVSDDLWFVLVAAQQLAERSDGAFDVTVGPYVKLWRRARREKEMPPAARMKDARQAVGYRYVKLTAEDRAVELLRPGMRLDLGGIAVGYAIDEAMIVLRQHGITRALVDGSGDILVSDPPPGERGWRIGVAPLEAKNGPPSRFLSLANCAVTTSGDAWQYVELEGKRYSHILDPRTGLGLTDRSLVIVVARDGITADSLTKAVAVLGPGQGLELVTEYPGAAALVLRPADGKIVQEESSNFRSFE